MFGAPTCPQKHRVWKSSLDGRRDGTDSQQRRRTTATAWKRTTGAAVSSGTDATAPTSDTAQTAITATEEEERTTATTLEEDDNCRLGDWCMMPTFEAAAKANADSTEPSDPGQMIDDRPLSKSAQVSFRLPNPQTTSSAEEPRNRRRLFRDMSYTSRAIKRDSRSSANGMGTFRQSSSDRAVPRRQDSFRKRRGDRGKAGGLRARFKTYCEERTRFFFANEQEREPIDQYYISPSDESRSIYDVFVRLFTLPFGELSVWVYETSFGKVLVFFLLLYLLIVYLFVILLYVADLISETDCVGNNLVGKLDDDSTTSERFELLFELSWTTLTTVGYGNLGIPNEAGCYIVRLACSIEALLGIGYVSACSGLFYVKLLKTLARAHVTFSSTMCIQYGRGLETGIKRYSALTSSALANSLTSFGSADSKQKKQHQPFPVIEFRVINDRANLPSGVNEIWDAEVRLSPACVLQIIPNSHTQRHNI